MYVINFVLNRLQIVSILVGFIFFSFQILGCLRVKATHNLRFVGCCLVTLLYGFEFLHQLLHLSGFITIPPWYRFVNVVEFAPILWVWQEYLASARRVLARRRV